MGMINSSNDKCNRCGWADNDIQLGYCPQCREGSPDKWWVRKRVVYCGPQKFIGQSHGFHHNELIGPWVSWREASEYAGFNPITSHKWEVVGPNKETILVEADNMFAAEKIGADIMGLYLPRLVRASYKGKGR